MVEKCAVCELPRHEELHLSFSGLKRITTLHQKILSLLSKDMLFYLYLIGSDFVSADEPHYLRDNKREREREREMHSCPGTIALTVPSHCHLRRPIASCHQGKSD